jgi:GGDEF domain-containing protein
VVPIGALVNLIGHVLAFGLVGIVAGEACGRIKYSLSALTGESAIDKESGVFNQRYAARALLAARGRFTRYEEPFSVVSVRLAESLWSELPEDRRRLVVRTIAAHLRSDVRLVDEVARLEDGSFMVILPHTPKAGGEVVAERAAVSMRRVLGASDRAVRATCYGAAEDAAWIDAALDLMNAGHSSSDAYSSSDESTVNPASRSTLDASTSSTFKTSTAAPSPHGSTKQ